MSKINIYIYDKRNIKSISKKIEQEDGRLYNWTYFSGKADSYKDNIELVTGRIYIDLSSLFYCEDRTSNLISLIEILIEELQKFQNKSVFLILDKYYSDIIKDTLYLKINEMISLEEMLNMETSCVKNIVDISNEEFDNVMRFISNNLFGNDLFKDRLKEELTKYRLFNKIGYQPIFSVFICGESGIGKTEVGRLLHKCLSPDEPFIKINFGNYSSHDAINSLIGSPRGYSGSNKGELTDKLRHSQSRIILIDEFEKANEAVYNFFLQLLEDGKFNDSLGREYDLNKYIIIFTSNIPKDEVTIKLSPELRSRFSYKCAFGPLTLEEKQDYVKHKSRDIMIKIKEKYPNITYDLDDTNIVNIDLNRFTNMRDVNSEIMTQIAEKIYPFLK